METIETTTTTETTDAAASSATSATSAATATAMTTAGEASGSGPLLLHNTMKITEGHLDGFREAVRRAVGFVEEHGPQLMVRVFIDEARLRAHSFQLYGDSEAVRTHWKLSDPYIAAVMEHCSVERLDLYGNPDAEVRAALEPGGPWPFPVSITPLFTGFVRLGGKGR